MQMLVFDPFHPLDPLREALIKSQLRNQTLARRRLRGFLHKAVEHHNPLTHERAEKYPGDTFGTLQTKLEQSVTEHLGMRFPEIRAERHDATGKHDVARSQRVGQRDYLCLHGFAVVADRVAHAQAVTNFLLPRKLPG